MSAEFKTSLVGGGQPLRNQQLLCSDARHLAVPFNNQLRVYLLTTRQCVRSLKFTPQNGLSLDGLVALKQDTQDENLLWAFLQNGDVIVLNWREKTADPVVKRLSLPLSKDDSVLSVVSFSADRVLTLTGKKSSNPHTRTLVSYSLTGTTTEATSLASVKSSVLFTASNNSQTLAFLTKQDSQTQIVLLNTTTLEKTTHTFPYKQHITCMALSNDGTIALGLQSGVIQLVFPDSSTRSLKWHIDSVKAIRFTNDGHYLLSGGLERVLVFWQLDTEKQQFLPRLSGEISNIDTSSDELYSVTMKLDPHHEQFELLVLSSTDLQSRLSVTGPRQSFTTPLSALKKVHKAFAKDPAMDPTRLKYDFTTRFQVHPTTKQLYFIHGANLQVFDFYKSEQSSVQKITSTLQTGKVRSELKLLDPEVKLFTFTKDGKWLATVEEHHHGELDNLLSKNDLTCVLKIWKFVETQKHTTATSSWELVTKIVNPHGVGIPVRSLIPAPASYAQGLGFLSADDNGGVRLWRPQHNTASAWSLRKLKPSVGLHSSAVSLAWSEDASIIFLGFEDSLTAIDIDSFEEIETPLTKISGGTVRSLQIVDHYLVILSSTSLKTVDLLTLQETELCLSMYTSKNAENLIAVNHHRGEIVVVVNYYERSVRRCQAKIFVFGPKSVMPLYTAEHDTYVSCVRWNGDSDYIFLDIESRIGLVSSSKISRFDNDEHEQDYEQQMSVLLAQAEATSKTVSTDVKMDNSEESNDVKLLDANSFMTLFDSIGTIKLETMFERVMQVVD